MICEFERIIVKTVESLRDTEDSDNRKHGGGGSGQCFTGSSVYVGIEHSRDPSAGRSVFTVVMVGTRKGRETQARCLRCEKCGRAGYGRADRVSWLDV